MAVNVRIFARRDGYHAECDFTSSFGHAPFFDGMIGIGANDGPAPEDAAAALHARVQAEIETLQAVQREILAEGAAMGTLVRGG
jgi:hypothetical protein